ncbi:peptidoglycan D,D-transpeptidase FtsI family protein [Phosphitispora fastidiosa]|uniref:peptidoglycan D,D-transpeptidase FtsI family protein n=1 Tax=Phosphitispora fastidiosa TaxID=2837202 RepID=UPI001E56ECA8|nr:penicillin-binding protein 2 [Phosphitispora fastidiosa]
MYNRNRKRTILLFWVFVIIFCSLAAHLAYIQIHEGTLLSQQALAQQTQLISLEIPPRGQILDRNLIPMVSCHEADRVIVFPWNLKDRDREARLLADVLGMDVSQIMEYFTSKARMIQQDLTSVQADELKSLSLPGIIVAKAKIRERKPVLAAHTLGFLGIGETRVSWEGKMGIEALYNSELKGAVPRSAARVFLDAKGKIISGLGLRLEEKTIDNERKDVVLTIDRQIQEAVEQAMERAGVREGAVVVMEAGTGDILALASRPDYYLGDGNPEEGYSESYLNHALLRYQPGSVFKVVVAAAVLEEGLVKPEETYLCVGEKDDIVKCYREEGHGLITFSQAAAYSCNPVFARLGLKLGAEKLVSYSELFGLDSADIGGYHTEDTKDRLNLIGQEFNLVNASLGQWPIEASVVQIAGMMNVVAGGGIYNPPRLVKMVVNDGGLVERVIEPGEKRRAVSENTAKILQQMLERVTREGTGKEAWVENWGSAGKTGSAQSGNGRIDAWFSGYAPLNSPRFVVTVLVKDGESGGQTAAPLFREIMQEILQLEK